MTVEPDFREAIWYDINNFLNIDPENYVHYWTMLIDKYKLIEDDIVEPFCDTHKTFHVFQHKKKEYCGNNSVVEYKRNGDLKSVKPKYPEQECIIIMISGDMAINKLLEILFGEILLEPTGNRLSLYDLESIMFGQPENGIFETKNKGWVTKNRIKRYLSEIKAVLLERLIMIRPHIRFGSTLRTPPIKV